MQPSFDELWDFCEVLKPITGGGEYDSLFVGSSRLYIKMIIPNTIPLFNEYKYYRITLDKFKETLKHIKQTT